MAKYRIPPIMKPRLPLDVLDEMGIAADLKSSKKESFGKKGDNKSFFIQKNFSKRFVTDQDRGKPETDEVLKKRLEEIERNANNTGFET